MRNTHRTLVSLSPVDTPTSASGWRCSNRTTRCNTVAMEEEEEKEVGVAGEVWLLIVVEDADVQFQVY